MDNFKLILVSVLLVLLSNCGLDKMAMDYNKVNFVQSPPILEAHGGNIEVDMKGVFPEEYFAKKAILEITPVIINKDGDESELNKIILQGEQASGGEATIFYESGGDFSYSGKISYDESMINSHLELRAVAKLDDDSKILAPVKIANGVIATSQLVENDEIIAFADHGYEDTTILSESATIYFLVNKSNIRTSEKSDADVQRLQEFIDKSYKTASFEIRSYASPEGSVSVNDDLSDARNENTLKYAKYLLRKLNADASSDDTKYTTVSVGEDWDGFYKLVNQSSISDKNIINRIVKSNKSPEQKEQAIRDMAEVYDAIDKNILPYLRKAEITILAYQPKKTNQEIIDLSKTDPSSLDVNELLYAAKIQGNSDEIYNTIIDLHNDWRAYNNIAAKLMIAIANESDPTGRFTFNSIAADLSPDALSPLDLVKSLLDSAMVNGGENQPDVLNNLGVLAAWNGDFDQAKTFFTDADAINYNKGNLSLRIGDYRAASRYYRGETTYNATLAAILHGDLSLCSENTAACYYLNAISGARSLDEQILFSNLEKAISQYPPYKVRAAIDLEFMDYRDHDKFKSLIE